MAQDNKKWFILNAGSKEQNGGEFIKECVTLEESILRTLLVVPYDVVYNVDPKLIDYMNLEDKNLINVYLESFFKRHNENSSEIFELNDFQGIVNIILEKAVELENVCNQLIIKRNYKIKHSPIW